MNLTFVRIISIIVLTFTAYSFMLSSPFKTMDDQTSIVANPLIKSFSHLPQLFTQGYFADQSYYRPLVNLTFMIEHHFFGLNSFYYNLDNLMIHVLNAFLVMALVGALLNRTTGFWVAFVFAIHPVHWEAVANIAGRAILLAGFFALISFLCFIYFNQRRHVGWLIASSLAFAFGLLCKESVGVLPGVLFLYAIVNVPRDKWMGAIGSLLPFALIIMGYIYVRHELGITQMFRWRNTTEYILGFVTFLRALITDIRLLFFPLDLHFDRSLKLFVNFFEAGALMTIFVWTVVLAWLGIARKKLTGLHWLLVGWFALEMLPVSQIITTIGVQAGSISTAEHFLYVASIPLIILCVHQLVLARYFKTGIILIISIFFVVGIKQNIYAQDELKMMERSLLFQPQNARLQSAVGLIYALKGEFVEAENHFREAVKAEPLNIRYRISLGKSLCDQKKWFGCLAQYLTIDDPRGFKELLVDNTTSAFKGVEGEMLKGKILNENDWQVLGVYYAKSQNMDEAILAFSKVLVFNPSNVDALFNLASLFEAKRQFPQARLNYENLLVLPSVSEKLRIHAKGHLEQMNRVQP